MATLAILYSLNTQVQSNKLSEVQHLWQRKEGGCRDIMHENGLLLRGRGSSSGSSGFNFHWKWALQAFEPCQKKLCCLFLTMLRTLFSKSFVQKNMSHRIFVSNIFSFAKPFLLNWNLCKSLQLFYFATQFILRKQIQRSEKIFERRKRLSKA